MVKKGRYSLFMLAVVCGMGSCSPKKSLPDLRESYSYKDTKPFGASVAYHIFANAYPEQNVELIKKDFAESSPDRYNQWDYDTSSLYINISRNFFISNRDAESLLDFAYKGNTVFIASAIIDTNLLAKIYCKQKADLSVYMSNGDQLIYTSLRYTDELSLYKDSFRYFYYPFNKYFSEINSSYARKAGGNADGKTNFFAFFWGKGRIFFHCEPRAFSNYFLLTGNNSLYMQELMQMLPAHPQNIYWDNIHNTRNFRSDGDEGSVSTLDMLMKYPALSRAFFISLGLLLLYIFFNSKRRQRIIPVIKPTENNSIAFTEAIAGLYLGKKDNKLISEKMITYFNEHVRSKYLMHINVQDPGYADMLSRKSGVSSEITAPLADAMRQMAASPRVSDQQLLLLNGLTEKFFKNKI